jgi:hypothetical protein
MSSSIQVTFQDKAYSFPLTEFKELFPTSFILDSLDATGIIPLTHSDVTPNLLSCIEQVLQNYPKDEMTPADAFTSLTAEDIKVASGYLGMTLVSVVTDPKYATFGVLSSGQDWAKQAFGPKWMCSAYISKWYEPLLHHAVRNAYASLMQYLFERMPPEMTVEADQIIFDRTTALLEHPQMLRMFLRRHIDINSFNGVVYYNLIFKRVDPEILKMFLDDERFDAKKYGQRLWKWVNPTHEQEKVDCEIYSYQCVLASHPKTAEFMFTS